MSLLQSLLLKEDKMKKVYIVVEDGLVREVFSEDEEVDIEIIDLDTDDNTLYEELLDDIKELRRTTHKIW
jgi:hypothetical protein